MGECLICDRIRIIKDKNNPYFVAELQTGYVVLGDFQFYKGYTFFLSKIHAYELHELPKDFKKLFLEEMAIVAEAIFKAFSPVKLNYELLGNSEKHCHWHIIPRYENDPNLKQPIWIVDRSIRCTENSRPSVGELGVLKQSIKKELETIYKI